MDDGKTTAMDRSTSPSLAFLSDALTLRAERQRMIASNIANADTPGYAARDFNFADALRSAASSSGSAMAATHTRHIATGGAGDMTQPKPGYSASTQPSLDGNSVDLDKERAKFTDNAVRYESTLRFINSHVKTMLSAIQGQ